MTKSVAAFRFSVDRLFADHAHVYMWTVTFPVLHADWVCSQKWRSFLNHLRQRVGRSGWGGLRVTELHKRHGVHFHFLCTERLPVDLIRRIGRCHGIGRVHVQRCRSVEDGYYLAKYLSKRCDSVKTESGRNGRKWAKFGDIEHTRVSDVQCDSDYWRYRRDHGLTWLGLHLEPHLRSVWLRIESNREFDSFWRAARQGDVSSLCAGALGRARGQLGITGAAVGVVSTVRLRGLVGRECPF